MFFGALASAAFFLARAAALILSSAAFYLAISADFFLAILVFSSIFISFSI